jgi:hypothetical protein
MKRPNLKNNGQIYTKISLVNLELNFLLLSFWRVEELTKTINFQQYFSALECQAQTLKCTN